MLERGTRALSYWNEEDDRQRTQEARHDLMNKSSTTKSQVMRNNVEAQVIDRIR